MAKISPIPLDTETFPIRTRPDYPPKPVSFSIKMPGWRGPKYFAWGHPTGGNNCTREDAKRILVEAYKTCSPEKPLLFHNAKFDLDVIEEEFGLALPPWHNVHDTMFLLFLDDPHQRSLGLKPSAERILNMLPEERDAVVDWILTHKGQLEKDFPEIVRDYGGIKPSTAGAFIAYCPGSIVGPYANGDITRTLGLFQAKYHEITVEREMLEAYDRERKLLPIFLRNEREGIRTDEAALRRDQPIYEAAQKKADDWLRKTLKKPDLDFDKDADVAKALYDVDALTEYSYTAPTKRFPEGQLSVSKKNMKLSHFKDRKVAAAYSYRQKCATVLETFIRPWQMYSKNGVMHTTWNQVRQAKASKGGDAGGTRTGRPSTNEPNFLNIPKKIEDSEQTGFIMPTHISGLPLLPRIRSYVLPDKKSHLVGRRDYAQQELRVLAHFEDGDLLNAYLEDVDLDVHEFTRLMIEKLIGIDVGRGFTKTLNFGFVYGQGLGSLAEKLDKTVEEVRSIRNAQMSALPGFKDLNDSIKKRAKAGDFISTWGGRQYYVEPPIFKDGRKISFEYKLLNYLIQGSSADITKEALIRYDEAKRDGRFMLTVYDEIDISAPKSAIRKEMLILRECMMSIELDVPLLSDGEIGPTLGNLEALKNEPKFDLSRWGL